MSTNMELITSVTVGSGGAASVRIPGTGTIPATYTDLKLVISGRSSKADITDYALMTFNGTSSNYSTKLLWGSGVNTGSFNWSLSNTFSLGVINAASNTASVFSSSEVYIPNYTSTGAKSISTDTVQEGNTGTNIYAMLSAGLHSTTGSALTYITLTCEGGSWVEGSTFYLYGISAVTSTPKATGGIVSQDATYWYHTFPFTSTFTPTTALSADILCIAGGGSGGSYLGGAGGAGGLVYSTANSLTATGYTVTVGAGGAATQGTSSVPGNNGSNSVFSSITAVGGGGGGTYNINFNGASGGSGGGGGVREGTSSDSSGGSPTSGQGYAGGNGSGRVGGTLYRGSGGGGGAGSAGNPYSNYVGGAGGNGLQYSTFANATFTGVNGYYAGGGGGAGYDSANGIGGAGGLGGGGRGGQGTATTSVANGVAGIINTGSGGGGAAGGDTPTSGAGGSGLVIIRYAK